jgi:hypothetical protein
MLLALERSERQKLPASIKRGKRSTGNVAAKSQGETNEPSRLVGNCTAQTLLISNALTAAMKQTVSIQHCTDLTSISRFLQIVYLLNSSLLGCNKEVMQLFPPDTMQGIWDYEPVVCRKERFQILKAAGVLGNIICCILLTTIISD